ncbi:MAG: cytidine deaminase [Candidatus Delongbacteria bacterium]
MSGITDEDLLGKAWEARKAARCGYSGFAVGAALEAADGRVFSGCNVESSSYGLSCCAERVALFKALSEGAAEFTRIAVVTDAPQVCPPCGACRQLLADYAPRVRVLMANAQERLDLPFADLYPYGFDQQFLARP